MFSCTQYKLMSIEKAKIIPGVATATPKYQYRIKIETIKENITFDKIILTPNVSIETCGVKAFDSSRNFFNTKEVQPGKYELSFIISSSKISKNQNNVKIHLKVGGKTKSIEGTAVIVKTKRLK